MSNCITIHEYNVAFSPEELDIATFEQIRKEHITHEYDSKGFWECLTLHKSPEEFAKIKSFEIDDEFCWFLRQNSQLLDTGELLISFGRGASTHTWRDFRATIWFLNQFIKKPKSHTFMISDEGDDHNEIFPITVHWPYVSFEELHKVIG